MKRWKAGETPPYHAEKILPTLLLNQQAFLLTKVETRDVRGGASEGANHFALGAKYLSLCDIQYTSYTAVRRMEEKKGSRQGKEALGKKSCVLWRS